MSSAESSFAGRQECETFCGMASSTPAFEAESPLMRALRALGRDDLAWSARRLHVPVPAAALVLEVGSGANPYPRSNVLLDAFEVTRERHFEPLVADRPTVLGRVERLPFCDDTFDFVIASHVLEHSDDPAAFLAELQRVARAGYIETPDAIFERLNPYLDHRLEVTERGGELQLRKKRASVHDPELVELFDARAREALGWPRPLTRHPFSFHLRFYWSRASGGIRYRLLDSTGGVQMAIEPSPESAPPPATLRSRAVAVARGLLSQRSRNQALDLLPLLRCPGCMAAPLSPEPTLLRCPACGATYRRAARWIDLNLPR